MWGTTHETKQLSSKNESIKAEEFLMFVYTII
jgi:hypothetical protein